MQKTICSILLLSVIVFLTACATSTDTVIDPVFVTETITFSAEDGLTVTADIYKTENDDAPYILLFHRANFSRGEYRVIAPRLNENGFNCLAIDQRSGSKARGVLNETAAEAKKQKVAHWYTDALADLRAAMLYAKEKLAASKIILWGSSYSAALSFVLGSEFPNDLSGILAFSPGEYFKIAEKEISSYARNIKCPVFITAEERIKNTAQAIYDSVPFSENNVFLDVNKHGSELLWPQTEPAWDQVINFLNGLLK
ncbi:MAG: lysophospholipase [Treponema sp.]|nr:lysophospholipase [Treponema sp.]